MEVQHLPNLQSRVERTGPETRDGGGSYVPYGEDELEGDASLGARMDALVTSLIRSVRKDSSPNGTGNRDVGADIALHGLTPAEVVPVGMLGRGVGSVPELPSIAPRAVAWAGLAVSSS